MAATVIVEFGGPGMAIVAAPQTSIGSFILGEPSLAGSRNLLFIEEPWTMQPLKDSCDKGMSSYYMSLRDHSQRAAGLATAVRVSCGVGTGSWGFTAESYKAVVDSIEQREHLAIKSFIGWSFASERWSYLSGLHLDWAILLRPHPLYATGQQILQVRAAAAMRDAARNSSQTIRPMSAVKLADRSLPVTDFDQWSAIAHSAYLDDDAISMVLKGITRGASPSEVGAYSDAMWGRYDVESISPSYLAQLDEGCTANGGWPKVPAHLNSVYSVLAAFWGPCQGVKAESPHTGPSGPLCVVVSSADPVVPAAMLPLTFPKGRPYSLVTVTQRQHLSFAGLSNCLAKVS